MRDGREFYTMWDVYPHADFVTYPAPYEGFGSALLETIYFRKPGLVNCYSTHVADIRPLGFEFVEVNGWITDKAVSRVRRLSDDPKRCLALAERHYELARLPFSYEVLSKALEKLLKF